MTIEEAQSKVDTWIKTFGVRYFNELTNMAILTEEVGEVARIIARRYGEQSFKKREKDQDLGDEMADVLWVLLCLANQTGVDLTKALEKNFEKRAYGTKIGIRGTRSCKTGDIKIKIKELRTKNQEVVPFNSSVRQ